MIACDHIWNRSRRVLRFCIVLLLGMLLAGVPAEAQRGAKKKAKQKSAAVARGGKKQAAKRGGARQKNSKQTAKKESKKKKKESRADTRRTSRQRNVARTPSSRTPSRTAPSTERTVRNTERVPAAASRGVQANESLNRMRQGTGPVQGVDAGAADLAQQTLHGRGSSTPARTRRSLPTVPPLSGDQVNAINNAAPGMEGMALESYPGLGGANGAAAKPFHAEGSLGLYTTGRLRAGYAGTPWPYDYTAHVDVGTTNGFIDNATRTSVTLGARGGYIIGNRYGIFSGGHMGANAEYKHDRYRRYALPDAPERSMNAWGIGLRGHNSNSGLAFELEGGYRRLEMDDAGTMGETSLDGAAKMRVEFSGLALGGEADLRLTNLNGTSISLARLEAFARYRFSSFVLRGGVALGIGKNSDGTSASRLAPLMEVNFFPARGITLAAGLQGGVIQTTMRDLLVRNPYVELMPTVRHRQEKIGYRAALRMEGWESFGARLSVSRSAYDDYEYFAGAGPGLFTLRYAPATVTRFGGDMFYQLTSQDMVALQAGLNKAELDSGGIQAPYVPELEGEVMYVRRFAGLPLTLTGTLRYVGVRNDETGAAMDGAVLLGAQGRYNITPNIYATLNLENLADMKYELWRGYRERGIFVAVGAGIAY